MTQEEQKIIEKALTSQNPTAAISDACREILLERIKDRNFSDRKLRFMVEDIISTSNFGFAAETIEMCVAPTAVSQSQGSTGKTLVWGLVCALGIICAFAFDSSVITGISAIVASVGAFSAAGALSPKAPVAIDAPEVKVVCATSAEEVGKRLDKYTDALLALFDYRQIETTHIDFLAWLQKQYADISDEIFRSSLVRLLKRFNYSLETYAEDKADCFDFYESNVAEPVTSVPAVFSPKGKVLLKGVYVVPLKK